MALALARAQVSTDRLAEMIWGDDRPATWQVALRGVIGGLRAACADLGSGQQLIVTEPSGYRIADGVAIDVDLAADAVRRAGALQAQGRHQAVLELVEPVSALTGSSLLSGEDAHWLDAHRRAIDALAVRA